MLLESKSRYPLYMGVASRKDELEEFKTKINLCEYASSCGFTLDRKQSSRSSSVMRHANGDKLIVARASNWHWMYFNVHDDRDKGTIIDFVQLRDRYSLGEVRKELRPWVGRAEQVIPNTQRQFIELVPSEHDVARVVVSWEKALSINGLHEYLERERKIPRQVLSDPIFVDRIRIDHRRNVLFAHYNLGGLCGFEIKNRGFTGFSPGGVKGFFCSRPRLDDNELVISETAIDALSFAALFGTECKRFFSTAGQISPAQKVILQSAAKKMPSGSKIILAMDNDYAGQQLALMITQALEVIDLNDKTVVTHLPSKVGEDWNDVLRHSGHCKSAYPTLE